MIYTINNCIRAFGYTNFDKLVADMGSVDNLKAYVIANGYADIAVAEDTELLLVDVNGKTWHTGCYGAVIEPPKPYLCFTSTGDSTVAMTQRGTPNTSAGKVLQYKLNDGQWQNWDLSAVTLADGDKMYVKSDDEIPVGELYNIYKYFVMSGSIAASGNIMSLLNFSTTLANYGLACLFQNCISLTQAPELPATTLSSDCYASMFSGCTALTNAPELPATTLSSNCYSSMFSGCTALTNAPELPATTLASYCYMSMFGGCTSLTTTPELPATILALSCYQAMFNNCTSLVQAPELPVTTLKQQCYQAMFSGCTALTNAPELPATDLQPNCYASMFRDCKSLTTAPALPATILTESCYYYMFFSCPKLNYVKAMFTDISAQDCLKDWLHNVSPTGTFIKSKDATWTNEQAGIPTGWTVQVEGGVTPEPEPERDYLCFTSTGDSTVALQQNGTPNTSANKVIQYKLNNGQWQTWDLSAVTLTDGDKMYLKSDDEIPISESNNIYKQFTMTGSIAASGNIMSLLNFSTTLQDYAFCRLFYTCSSLTTAPALPVTTLVNNCYKWMFRDCKSLTQAPELPATTLVNNCYPQMFNGCSKLNYVKAMFTDVPSEGNPVSRWLENVSSTGTFIKSKDATWTNDAAGIPSGWTVQVEGGVTPEPEPERDYLCFTSTGDSTVAMIQTNEPTDISKNKVIQYKLNGGQWQTWDLSAVTLSDGDKMYVKSDDEIPMAEGLTHKHFNMTGSIAASGNIMSLLNFSTTMPDYAFYSLFYDCTSLTTAPALPATTLATYCYSEMFYNCTSLTTAPALPATTLKQFCYEGMFYGCTSLTTAPELPATTLADYCYYEMFKGCSQLNYVKAMFTTDPFGITTYWLDGVSETGTFVKNSAATWTNTSAGIPSGWTVQTASPDK